MGSFEHHHHAFHRQEPERSPGFWLGASILASIFCCMPLAVVGIVYAALALGARDPEDQRRKVRLARLWTLWSVVIGLVIVAGAFCVGWFGES